MNFSYENQGSQTYLVCTLSESDVIDTMTLGMLTNNKIEGLADTTFTQLDDKKFVKYNITSKVSVKQFFTGAVNKKRLLGVFMGVTNAMLSAEDYMIEATSVVLDTGYIFADVSTCDTVLICRPIIIAQRDVDLRAFFKNILFTAQYDQTENCDHVAKIMNYLNSSPAFSLLEFKKLLSGIISEDTVTVSSRPVLKADTQAAPQPAPQSAPQPAPQSAPQPISQTIPQAVPKAAPQPTPQFTPRLAPQFGARPAPMPQQSMQQPAAQAPQRPISPQTPPQAPSMSAPRTAPAQPAPSFQIPGASPSTPAKGAAVNNKPTEKKSGWLHNLFGGGGKNKVDKKSAPAAGAAPMGATPAMPPRPMAQAMPQGMPAQGMPAQTMAVPQTMPSVQPLPAQSMPSVRAMPAPQTMPSVRPAPSVQPDYGETSILSSNEIGNTTVLSAKNDQTKNVAFLLRKSNNEKIPINKDTFKIGKERSYVDYFISDNTAVSRSHANIIFRDGTYFITDTNSTNHTYVNGKMLNSGSEVPLRHNDVIMLANEEFEFRMY